MINRIFNDLQNNIRKIYSGSNIITINKYFHHSLRYEEMITLLTKYKGNYQKLTAELFEHIEAYETGSNKTRSHVHPFGLNGFDEEINDEITRSLSRNNQVFREQELGYS